MAAGGLGDRDHFVVPDRTARVHDGPDAGVDQHLQPVREREERVPGRDRALGPVGTGSLHRQPAAVDPVHLAHSDPDTGTVIGQQDRVRLDRPDRAPGELQIGQGGRVGRRPGHQPPGGRRVAPGHRLGPDHGVDPVHGLQQHPAADRPELHSVRERGDRHLQQADVALAVSTRTLPARSPGRRSPR